MTMVVIALSLAAALASAQGTPEPASVASGNVSIEVGKFDPDGFPRLRLKHRDMPLGAMLHRVESLMRDGRCSFPGQRDDHYDIRVPYLAQLAPDGALTRVIVADIGCQPLEVYVGTMVRELAKVGDLAANRAEGKPQWFAHEARFTVQ